MKKTNRRGFTLIEVMVAVAILAAAGLGTLSLIGVLIRSNQHVSAQTEALALATQLVTEIQNAQYVQGVPAMQDPGLAPAPGVVSAPRPLSRIVTVGRFSPPDPTPVPVANAARFLVTYEIVGWNEPVSGNPGGVDILVTVDNDRDRAGIEGLSSSEVDALMRPVQIVVRKEFSGSPTAANNQGLRW